MHEKYRPTTWNGVVGQDTDEIRVELDGLQTPNFLFYGPPGTGKTTVAQLIARELQGSESELMTFNASDDRGIDTVRDDIIPAADQTTLSGAPRVVFLDEMDSMTKEAQQALRNPMEQSKAVFILACNEVDAVHDAVRSRCHDYKFGPIPDRAIRSRIAQLAKEEDVQLSDNDMKMVVSFANGDMRGAIQRYSQIARGVISNGNEPDTDGDTLESEAHEFLTDY